MKISLQPAEVYAGEPYAIQLDLAAESCVTGEDPLKNLDHISASSPTEIKDLAVTSVQGLPCRRVVSLAVSSGAYPGIATLYLHGKGTDGSPAILGTASLTLKAARAEPNLPIPEGLHPKVDISWKVLPRRVVADRYGNRVADHFFDIHATIGNNTGHELQISSLAFNPDVQKGFVDMSPAPSDPYHMVRGTVEREQSVGTRSIMVNLVRSVGTILVGVGGYYFNAPSGTFNSASAIFNGPVEKGLELVYPDLTTNHLISLDNNMLHEGTVLANNHSTEVEVLISRELVQCSYPTSFWRFGRTPRKGFKCPPSDDWKKKNRILEDLKAEKKLAEKESAKEQIKKAKDDLRDAKTDKRLNFVRNFNPDEVREALGELVLVGKSLDYLDRVVAANQASDIDKSSPLLFSNQIEIEQKRSLTKVLAGLHLKGAGITSPDPTLKLANQKVNSEGTEITFDVDASNASVGSILLQLHTPYGSVPIYLQITQPPTPAPVVAPTVPAADPPVAGTPNPSP